MQVLITHAAALRLSHKKPGMYADILWPQILSHINMTGMYADALRQLLGVIVNAARKNANTQKSMCSKASAAVFVCAALGELGGSRWQWISTPLLVGVCRGTQRVQ